MTTFKSFPYWLMTCASMHEKVRASAHMHVFISRVENSADPDQLASEQPADLDQHRFPNRIYCKTCLELSLKKDKTKILMTNGSLMKVESIEECSP